VPVIATPQKSSEATLAKLKDLFASVVAKGEKVGEEALKEPGKLENTFGQLPKAVDSLAAIGGGGGVSLTTDIAKSQLSETKKTNQLLSQLVGARSNPSGKPEKVLAPNNEGQKISRQQVASPV